MVRRLLFLAAAATVALGACSSGASTAPALTDPRDILTRAIATLKDAKALHLHAEVSGQVKFDLTGSGHPGELDLKGTNADADIDIPNKKAHLSFRGPLGLTGDVIVIDRTRYTRISLLGARYTRSDATSSNDPTSAVMDPQKMTDELNAVLSQPGVAPIRQPDEKCGDRDCYHITLNLTSDQLGGMTGVLGSALPSGSGTVDVWVQKNDLHPAKATIAANGGDRGTLEATLTMSNYDAPVTISAPADTEIKPAAS